MLFWAILVVKNADLEAFAVPRANAMWAIWAVSVTPGKLYTGWSLKESVWRAYFIGFHAEKDPGLLLHFNVDDTLNEEVAHHVRPVRLSVPLTLLLSQTFPLSFFCVVWGFALTRKRPEIHAAAWLWWAHITIKHTSRGSALLTNHNRNRERECVWAYMWAYMCACVLKHCCITSKRAICVSLWWLNSE